MSADKPLSPEVVASPSAPETAGEHADLNKTNETAVVPSPLGAAPADTPVGAAEPSAASTPEAPAVSGEGTAPEPAAESSPETLADGQPPLPPVPPSDTMPSPAVEPENLPIQSESTPPATPEDKAEEEEADDRPMGLMDHLSELRGRLVRCCLAVMLGFIACWAVVDPIFDALVAPLLSVLPDGSHAIYTTLPEGFFTRMHIAFVAGVFVSSPAIFYQVWAFIAPGL